MARCSADVPIASLLVHLVRSSSCICLWIYSKPNTMLSALVRRGLSGPAASALTRLQASAGLSTGSVARHQAAQDPNDPPYVFKDHCRGKRAVSKEAEEVTER